MNELVLSIRDKLPHRLDMSALNPDRLFELSMEEIKRLPLRFESGEPVETGELCDVKGTASRALRLVGDWSFADGIGTGLSLGTIRVDGNAGHRTGFRMRGGSIQVHGHTSDDTGLEMSGGTILVHGSAGRRTGSTIPGAKRGMTGGEIVILGDAGSETGACMRRGMIAVSGKVGPNAAQAAIAGTVLAVGDIEAPAGRWSKRASLIGLSQIPILPTYTYACTFKPSYLRLLLTYLRRKYNFPITNEHVDGRFSRYCGDMAESTRGEILQWVGD